MGPDVGGQGGMTLLGGRTVLNLEDFWWKVGRRKGVWEFVTDVETPERDTPRDLSSLVAATPGKEESPPSTTG